MSDSLSRRQFLRSSTAAATLAVAAPRLALGGQDEGKKPAPLPRRALGRSGVQVPILNLGTSQSLDTRLLNTVYDHGVHYFDTADCYENGNSERAIADWFGKSGKRQDIFLVTKDHPKTPDEWVQMVDHRLEALQVDHIDMFFIHALGDGGGYGGYPIEFEGGKDWPKSKEWAAAADKMKKSGKVKLVGFSTHCKPIERRIALLDNAAQGGWVDALMVATDPRLIRTNDDLNRALDACHKAGVGLISMKEVRGGLAHVKEDFPEFKDKGLTPHTAVLAAIWSDERFTTICSHMDNIKKVQQNADAARDFKPLTGDELGAVHRMLHDHPRRFCHGCDGSCHQAAGTQTAFADIARYLSYYEEDGRREEARALYAALPPEQRDWSDANLCAASRACVGGLDMRDILTRAAQKLA
ncbi:MAG TPA: aldo/keto reductase [Phycisphaerae bacterium]|nr:aldo/keto reductase [Phycisphaerae bacterium]